MEEILHQLIGSQVVYPIICTVLDLPGGDRRISEPSWSITPCTKNCIPGGDARFAGGAKIASLGRL